MHLTNTNLYDKTLKHAYFDHNPLTKYLKTSISHSISGIQAPVDTKEEQTKNWREKKKRE